MAFDYYRLSVFVLIVMPSCVEFRKNIRSRMVRDINTHMIDQFGLNSIELLIRLFMAVICLSARNRSTKDMNQTLSLGAPFTLTQFETNIFCLSRFLLFYCGTSTELLT